MRFNLLRRPILWMGVVLLGIAMAALYLRREQGAFSPSHFTVDKVTRGDIVQSVATTGQLNPLVTVEVSTQISGLVTEVGVDFNTPVKKGQVLARIDPATYVQRLQQTQADYAAAQATHALTTLNARRLKGLLEQGIISQQEYDQTDAQREQSQASLLTRQAAVQNARLDLERCTLVSPIDGIVIFKQVEVGKTIQASFSAPTLFVIAQDLSKMRIIAPISEVDVWSVRPGQKVSFTVDALPDRTFHGQLIQIRNPYTPSERQQQQQSQQENTIANFDGVIEVDNAKLLLRPSLTANVSIAVARREQVLRIANGALRVDLSEAAPAALPAPRIAAAQEEASGAAVVYRLPGGDRDATPEAVAVTLGVSDGLVTEVTRGLAEGDLVVTGFASSAERERQREGAMRGLRIGR